MPITLVFPDHDLTFFIWPNLTLVGVCSPCQVDSSRVGEVGAHADL